jgi:hypothetical protein
MASSGDLKGVSYKVDQLDQKLGAHHQETTDGFDAVHRVIGGMSHSLSDHEERMKALEGGRSLQNPPTRNSNPGGVAKNASGLPRDAIIWLVESGAGVCALTQSQQKSV